MVRLSRAVSLFALILLIYPINHVVTFTWMEEDLENIPPGEFDYNFGRNLEEFNRFSENQDTRNRITRKLIKKKMPILTSAHEDKRLVPIYRTVAQKDCSCVLGVDHIDLGDGYYPRLIKTGICKPESCDKHYRCREKNYKIQVLKARTLDDIAETVSRATPPPLREAFTLETVTVAVGCQCIIDN